MCLSHTPDISTSDSKAACVPDIIGPGGEGEGEREKGEKKRGDWKSSLFSRSFSLLLLDYVYCMRRLSVVKFSDSGMVSSLERFR